MPPMEAPLQTILDLWYTKYEDRELNFDVDSILRAERVDDWLARQMCIVIFHHCMSSTGSFDKYYTFPAYKLFAMESAVDETVRVRLTLTTQRNYKPYDLKDALWKL